MQGKSIQLKAMKKCEKDSKFANKLSSKLTVKYNLDMLNSI